MSKAQTADLVISNTVGLKKGSTIQINTLHFVVVKVIDGHTIRIKAA